MRLRTVITFVAIMAILASCGRRESVRSLDRLQASLAAASDTGGTPVWDERLDCFNGLFMVRSNGLYGITDESGAVLVPPECDSLEFLSDEVLLLFKGGMSALADRRGRVFAENGDSRILRDNFQGLRDKAADEGLRRWSAYLDDFESFGR